MDRLELAERQYRELVPRELLEKSKAERDLGARRLNAAAWVRNYVVPAVEELWRRPRYQLMATWALRTFASSSESAERQLLLKTEKALTDCAKALLKLADRPKVAEHMSAAYPAQWRVTREVVVLSNDSPHGRVVDRHVEPVDDLPMFRQQAAFIAEHRWETLACLEDYFCPVCDIVGNAGGPAPKRGRRQPRAVARPVDAELCPFFNADLVPVGDFITRAMMARVDAYRDCLGRFRIAVHRAADAGGVAAAARLSETSAWEHLGEQRDALHCLCLTGRELIIRESAICLCQVYLSFRTRPDIEWLGLSNDMVRSGASLLRSAIMRPRELTTLDRIAAALGSLRELYRDYPPEQSAFEEALATGGLVLVENPPEMYWDKQLLPIVWSRQRAAWAFWLAMAKKSRRGLCVNAADLAGDPHECNDAGIYSRKERADRVVRPHAAKLAHAISPGVDRKTYRLDLDTSLIHVLPRRR